MAKKGRESREGEVGSEGSSSGIVSSLGSGEKKNGEVEGEGLIWSEKNMEGEQRRREREERRREKRRRDEGRKLHLWEEI